MTGSEYDYAALRRLVEIEGLFDRSLIGTTIYVIYILALLAFGVWFLSGADTIGSQMLVAVYFAFTYLQWGFLTHDSGHRSVFKSKRANDIAGRLSSLVFWVDFEWWRTKHNEHHSHPNHEGLDPDINFPMLAFTEEQAQEKRGFNRFIARHQGFLLFPLQILVGLSVRYHSIEFLLTAKRKDAIVGWSILAIHLSWYLFMVFSFLEPLNGVLFIVAHQAFFGLYLATIFAPNHKGMPIIRRGEKVDFLRSQILTARNIKSNALIDFLYGGVNYQIEHHVFPMITRRNLPKLRLIVKKFCEEKRISYCEVSVFRSYLEIARELHRISRFV